MKSFIVPLINNKTGDTSDTCNYIPVAIDTLVSLMPQKPSIELIIG